MQPEFLTLAEVLAIHEDQVERYGGEPGVRDMNLLKSAAATPMATFGDAYLHTDIFEMAAAYLYHLVRNHPFLDGNKRTGTVAALVFLLLNGYECGASPDDLAEMVLAVARGEGSKADISVFLQRHTPGRVGREE